jgi:hypothetical protein
MRRWLIGLTGLVLLLFGLGCLNYTKADALEHHQEVARQHGLPPPSRGIFCMGVAVVVLGAGALGYAIGARPSCAAFMQR